MCILYIPNTHQSISSYFMVEVFIFLQRSFEICRRLILSHVDVAVRVLSFWWFWVSFGLILFLRILSCTAKQGTELPLAFSLFISAG